MKKLILGLALSAALVPAGAALADSSTSLSKVWQSKNAKMSEAPQLVVYDAASAMEFLRSMNGEWVSKREKDSVSIRKPVDEHGETETWSTIAGGTTVMQRIVPDGPYEMSVMYHMDGPDKLWLRHYCSARNVPELIFQKSDRPGEIVFKFHQGFNMDTAVDNHTVDLTYRIIDKDTVETIGGVFANGKPTTIRATAKRVASTEHAKAE